MIEQLSELVSASGVSRMNLSIQNEGGSDQVAVVIQCVLGQAPENASDQQKALRAALAMPITVSGYVGEVDVKLEEMLYQYVHKVKPVLNSLTTNIEKVIEKTDAAGVEKKTDTETENSTVETDRDPKENALTNGDAESL
jgi:PRTRC genetic system protein E